MMAAVLALALLQQPDTASQAQGRPCQVAIDTVGHYGRQVEVKPGETNLFAGGGVKAHCQGTTSTLSADSVAWYAGVGRFDMLGGVRIRDTSVALDATTASYFVRDERLEAHRNVVATNRSTGTVLRGPNLTYYRVARGIRDTAEMYATSRPTIEYHSAPPPDTSEPYSVVADRVRMKGNDLMWAGGSVTVDRSDFAARADSLMLDQHAGRGVLVGNPVMEGKGEETYRLVGRRIELGIEHGEIRRVAALGAARATSRDWRLTADTIHLLIDRHKLQQVFAWGDSSRPRAVSALRTIVADSLALDVPDEVLTEARAYGNAVSTSRRDSTPAAEQDWITGDTVTAQWITQSDSAPGRVSKSVLRRLIASGKARALTHLRNERDSTQAPSLNYSRGARIDILLAGDRIDTVVVTGRADGLQLAPLPPVDTTRRAADTTRAARRHRARTKP